MTEDTGILIKNIYYMLTYAFRVLKQTNYEEIAGERFKEIQDLFAAILAKGISQQLKQGLYREYAVRKETASTLRGKINIQETIHHKLQRKKVIACEYDELTENNLFNQILKTTSLFLIRSSGVTPEHKKALKKNVLYFDGIDVIEKDAIPWDRLVIRKNNQSYEMLLNICYFVLNGFLQTTEKGNYKMAQFSDELMSRLYEKFVLEYYRKHHKELSVSASQIDWNLGDEQENSAIQFLPIMQTDITLKNKHHTLVIDTKYYSHTMQSNFNSYTYHSGNMYQIFTYVKNLDTKSTGNVSGMLLYARTGERITPDASYMIGGNKISIKTLNLNCDFTLIAQQLDKIAEDTFGKSNQC